MTPFLLPTAGLQGMYDNAGSMGGIDLSDATKYLNNTGLAPNASYAADSTAESIQVSVQNGTPVVASVALPDGAVHAVGIHSLDEGGAFVIHDPLLGQYTQSPSLFGSRMNGQTITFK
jgi:hypothetical protein